MHLARPSVALLIGLAASACNGPSQKCPRTSTALAVPADAKAGPTAEPGAAATPPATTTAPAEPGKPGGSVEQILVKEGRFSWSDGTSVYSMAADRGFKLQPVGMSGRTVTGKWRWLDAASGMVEVTGQWSWINGVSPTDDYRKMTFAVRSPLVRARNGGGLYQPFFNLEELVKISKDAYEAGVR